MIDPTKRQTLNTLPIPAPRRNYWNSLLLFIFGVTLGACLMKSGAPQHAHETLTELDRAALNQLLEGL